MTPEAAQLLRLIPQVEKLLVSPACESLLAEYPRPLVTEALRETLDDYRKRLLDPTANGNSLTADAFAPEALAKVAQTALERGNAPYYCRVINATGIVLHTALGRAPLPEAAVVALRERAGFPIRVEMDLESGDRGGRDEGCSRLLRELTGAEAATVVNNNAAATLLILAAIARGKKVLLSRGEMVECRYRNLPPVTSIDGFIPKREHWHQKTGQRHACVCTLQSDEPQPRGVQRAVSPQRRRGQRRPSRIRCLYGRRGQRGPQGSGAVREAGTEGALRIRCLTGGGDRGGPQGSGAVREAGAEGP